MAGAGAGAGAADLRARLHEARLGAAAKRNDTDSSEVFRRLSRDRINLASLLVAPVQVLTAVISSAVTFVFLNLIFMSVFLQLWGLGLMLVGTRTSAVLLGNIVYFMIVGLQFLYNNAVVKPWNWAMGAVNSAIDAVLSVHFNIGEAFDAVWDGITGAVDWVADAFDSVTDAIDGAVDAITDTIYSVADGITDAIKEIEEFIGELATKVKDGIEDAASDVGGAVKDGWDAATGWCCRRRLLSVEGGGRRLLAARPAGPAPGHGAALRLAQNLTLAISAYVAAHPAVDRVVVVHDAVPSPGPPLPMTSEGAVALHAGLWIHRARFDGYFARQTARAPHVPATMERVRAMRNRTSAEAGNHTAASFAQLYEVRDLLQMLRGVAAREHRNISLPSGAVLVTANGTFTPLAVELGRGQLPPNRTAAGRRLLFVGDFVDGLLDTLKEGFNKVRNFGINFGTLFDFLNSVRPDEDWLLDEWNKRDYTWLRIMRACGCRAFTNGIQELKFLARMLLSQHLCAAAKDTAVTPFAQSVILGLGDWALLRDRSREQTDCEGIDDAFRYLASGVVDTMTLSFVKVDALEQDEDETADAFRGQCVARPSTQTLGCFFMGIGWLLMTLVMVLLAALALYSWAGVVSVAFHILLLAFRVANNLLIFLAAALSMLRGAVTSSQHRLMIKLAHGARANSLWQLFWLTFSVEVPQNIVRTTLVLKVALFLPRAGLMLAWRVAKPLVRTFGARGVAYARRLLGRCARRSAGRVLQRYLARARAGVRAGKLFLCENALCMACARCSRRAQKDLGPGRQRRASPPAPAPVQPPASAEEGRPLLRRRPRAAPRGGSAFEMAPPQGVRTGPRVVERGGFA